MNADPESKVTILARTKSEPEKREKMDTFLDNLSRNKSEISILLEFSLRFNKPLSFELVNESGPSHIKKFVTKCSMGSTSDQLFEALGEGNSKKQSKQKSAVEMLKILSEKHPQSLESLFCKKETIKKTDSKNASAERKKRKTKSNIIVANKTSPEYGSGTINPITRLIQIQQAKKQPEPLFELVSSVNRYKKSDVTKSRSEFCMSVSVLDPSGGGELVKCEAKGPNKKVAKQNAAEAMLVELGYPSVSSAQHIKPVLKSPEENGEKSDKKVKFIDPNEHGQQEHKDIIKIKSSVPNKIKLYKDQLKDRACEVNVLLDKSEFGVCATISKELLDSIEKNDKDFYSQSAEDYLSQREQGSSVISAKDFNETEHGKAKLKILTNGSEGNYKAALDYLANIFNFKCNYQSILGRDRSINTYLSLSILSNMDKPFSGQGATRVHSSNLAAAAALNYLANHNQA
ncbi:double-stranded RNA-binding protein Staufen 2 -like [Brachionus plicatilis]|uniref:Double-stranded RNA-binding protein Staufen 2-like n=1 Tax=Brachionus plicatilis TaxID=10195 RepID=A0A3M7SY14_BRAPC|nr:double-stranded RNA-binding protein Staufen 2 -like [Brachionus plicatilis]